MTLHKSKGSSGEPITSGGTVTVSGTIIATAAGTQDVSIVNQTYVPLLAQLYAGTNNIGVVQVAGGTIEASQGTTPWLSRLHSGTNNIGVVQIAGGTIEANQDTYVDLKNESLLAGGTNTIGKISDCILATGTQVSGTVVTWNSGLLPQNKDEYLDSGSFTTIANTSTLCLITLNKGTNWALKDVYLYCPDAGGNCMYSITKGTSTLAQDVYYGCTTFVTFDKVSYDSGSLTVTMLTDSAGTGTLLVSTKYYYY